MQKRSQLLNGITHSHHHQSHSDRSHRHDKNCASLHDCVTTQTGDTCYSVDHNRIGRSLKNKPYSPTSCDGQSSDESLNEDNKCENLSRHQHRKHTTSKRNGDRRHRDKLSGSSHEVNNALNHHCIDDRLACRHHHHTDWFVKHRHERVYGHHSSHFRYDCHGTHGCRSRSCDKIYHHQQHRSTSQNSPKHHKRYDHR